MQLRNGSRIPSRARRGCGSDPAHEQTRVFPCPRGTAIEEPWGQHRTVSARPSGAVTKARTTPLISSSRYGALPASRCVTDPADIRLLTEPAMSSSRASGGSPRKCDAAARMSASKAETYDAAYLAQTPRSTGPIIRHPRHRWALRPQRLAGGRIGAWEHRHQRHRGERVPETETVKVLAKT